MESLPVLSLPLFLKLIYTAFVLFIIPVYWKNWGPGNFLWFSDIALFLTAIALWLDNSLLASMMALSILLPETGWNIDFFGRLISGKRLLGLSDYMFDKERSLFLRGLSLFHVFLPVLLVIMLMNYGYQESALYFQTAFAWMILLLTYFFTDPEKNINWVFGPGNKPQKRIPSWLYLFLLMLFFPLCIYLPTHLFLMWFIGS